MENNKKTYLIVELDKEVKGENITSAMFGDKSDSNIWIYDVKDGLTTTKAIIPSKYTVILIE